MLCPKCKSEPVVITASPAEPSVAEVIASQQPVIVGPTTTAEPATTSVAPGPPIGRPMPRPPSPAPVAQTQAPGGSVKCSMCPSFIKVAELDPRCLPEKPMCPTCMSEFEQFLGAPQPVEHPTEPAPPIIEATGEVVSEGNEVAAAPLAATPGPAQVFASPMDGADVFKSEEQPFVRSGCLYLTSTTGRIIIRASDWVALQATEEPGLVRIHMSREIVFFFDVVGSPERIVEVCSKWARDD